MATTNTNDLRITNAKNFIKGLWDEKDENTYLSFGRVIPWADPMNSKINDNNPPIPKNNIQDNNKARHQIISLESVSSRRAQHLIPKLIWKAGVIYDMYRHDYSYNTVSSSGAQNLYDAKFVVVNSRNEVYACLYNGTSLTNKRGTLSRREPLVLLTGEDKNPNYQPFYTQDGYQWIYLYTLSESMIIDSTDKLIPIPPRYSGTIINGPVNTILIERAGSNYSEPPGNARYYFCRITGDGKNGIARVFVSNYGTIQRIEVVNPGQNYTYANLDFRANFVYKSVADLLNNRNGLDPGGDENLVSNCIISPRNGWGADLVRQLGGTRVGLFITSTYVDDIGFSDIYDGELSFRQILVLHNIIKSKNSSRLDATFAVQVNIASGTGYRLLEQIEQSYVVGNETKVAKGLVVGWNPTTRILRYIQDPSIHSFLDGNMWSFKGNRNIIGKISRSSSKASNLTATLDNRRFTNGYSMPEFEKMTGDILYMSNIMPIPKISQQSEEVSIIYAF